MLSPELKEKISLTVHQAIVALVRERRRYRAFASESFNPLPVKMTEAARGEIIQNENDSKIEGHIAKDYKVIQRESEPHPDSVWND